jgi:hypothetical protein
MWKKTEIDITPVFVLPGVAPITRIRRFPKLPTYEPAPGVAEAVARRLSDFQPDEPYITRRVIQEVASLIRIAHPDHVDKTDPDALIAAAVHFLRRDVMHEDPPASWLYELERYADFFADAYAAREAYHNRPRRGRPRKRKADGATFAGRYS